MNEKKLRVMPVRPSIICVGGPGCAGKDTIIDELLSRFPEWRRVPRHTTRERRQKKVITPDGKTVRRKEINGVDYHFDSPQLFNELLQSGKLQGEGTYGGHMYAVDVPEIKNVIDQGMTVIGSFGSCSFRLRQIFPVETFLIYITADVPTLLQRARAERRGKENNYRLRVKGYEQNMSKEGVLFDVAVLNSYGRNVEEVEEEVIGHLRTLMFEKGFRIAGFEPT